MGYFTHVLHVKEGKREEWILTRSLTYVPTVVGYVWVVPKGFDTDLASIPKLFRTFFAVNGKHRKAAALHDWLYREGKLSRKECDLLFLEAMKVCGVSKFKRYSMYAAVRVGGASSYKGDK